METVRSQRFQCPADTSTGLQSSQRHVNEALTKLVMLMETQEDGTGADESPEESEEILLDVELDGYRYILLRRFCHQRAQIHLSPREQEIVRMVAKGHPNKVIADVLNISSWTVCTHLRRIFAKLGVTSRAAMVGELLQIGLLRGEYPRSAYGR